MVVSIFKYLKGAASGIYPGESVAVTKSTIKKETYIVKVFVCLQGLFSGWKAFSESGSNRF